MSATSMRNLFKELQESINNFSTLLITIIAAATSATGNSLFSDEHKLMMMSLVLIIVLYSFLVIIGTILQEYNRSLLPFITCAIVLLGSAASVLALRVISPTVAWITLALWVGMFILVAYDYAVPQRIKNWIEGRIERSSSLLPF
ncbi:hypothetical protein SESBI_45356 [Sesbania bispinosa]|nr:hypothetical protein SESBI_45356 [Sesbania bispinosa]